MISRLLNLNQKRADSPDGRKKQEHRAARSERGSNNDESRWERYHANSLSKIVVGFI